MKAPTSKRLPKVIDSDGIYTRGLIAGTRAAQPIPQPAALNDAYHRGHTAGLYAALTLLADQLGITI